MSSPSASEAQELLLYQDMLDWLQVYNKKVARDYEAQFKEHYDQQHLLRGFRGEELSYEHIDSLLSFTSPKRLKAVTGRGKVGTTGNNPKHDDHSVKKNYSFLHPIKKKYEDGSKERYENRFETSAAIQQVIMTQKETKDRYNAGVSPAVLLTEQRRKMILHALAGDDTPDPFEETSAQEKNKAANKSKKINKIGSSGERKLNSTENGPPFASCGVHRKICRAKLNEFLLQRGHDTVFDDHRSVVFGHEGGGGGEDEEEDALSIESLNSIEQKNTARKQKHSARPTTGGGGSVLGGKGGSFGLGGGSIGSRRIVAGTRRGSKNSGSLVTKGSLQSVVITSGGGEGGEAKQRSNTTGMLISGQNSATAPASLSIGTAGEQKEHQEGQQRQEHGLGQERQAKISPQPRNKSIFSMGTTSPSMRRLSQLKHSSSGGELNQNNDHINNDSNNQNKIHNNGGTLVHYSSFRRPTSVILRPHGPASNKNNNTFIADWNNFDTMRARWSFIKPQVNMLTVENRQQLAPRDSGKHVRIGSTHLNGSIKDVTHFSSSLRRHSTRQEVIGLRTAEMERVRELEKSKFYKPAHYVTY